MYKILLCCVSGVTTNKLVKAVKESAKQKDIKVMCWAVGSKSVGLSWADADCVLLAPQSASELSKFEEMAGIAFDSVNLSEIDVFFEMNGEAVLNQALDLIKK